MNDTIVRIESIEIKNFKNVGYGHLDLEIPKGYKASILGLYGQNGSGKTALIDALELLQFAFQADQLPITSPIISMLIANMRPSSMDSR